MLSHTEAKGTSSTSCMNIIGSSYPSSTISIIGYYERFSDDQSEFDGTDIDPLSPMLVPKVERQSPALTALSGPLTRTRSKTASSLLRRDSSASIIGYELLEKPSAKAAGKKRKAATDVPAASTSAKKAKDSNPIEPPLPTPIASNSGGPVFNYYGSSRISAAVAPAPAPAVASSTAITRIGISEPERPPPFMLKGVTCWDLHPGEGQAAASSGTVGICFVLAVIDPVDRKRKTDIRELRPPALVSSIHIWFGIASLISVYASSPLM